MDATFSRIVLRCVFGCFEISLPEDNEANARAMSPAGILMAGDGVPCPRSCSTTKGMEHQQQLQPTAATATTAVGIILFLSSPCSSLFTSIL